MCVAAWARGGAKPTPCPATGLLGREHLAHGVTHVRHHFDLADLAVRVEVDPVLRGDDDLLTGARDGVPAVGERAGEVHRHAVGDDEAVLAVVFPAVRDLDLLAQVGEGGALPFDLTDQLGEAQVGLGFAEVGSEPRGGEPQGLARLSLQEGVEEGSVGGLAC